MVFFSACGMWYVNGPSKCCAVPLDVDDNWDVIEAYVDGVVTAGEALQTAKHDMRWTLLDVASKPICQLVTLFLKLLVAVCHSVYPLTSVLEY